MSPLELTLRFLGVAELGLLALILVQARRRDHVARIGAALAASLAAFMLTSMPGAAALFGAFVFPLTALCATHPVWFWLFCGSLFNDGFRLRGRHVACIAAMALAGVAYQLAPSGMSPALLTVLGGAFGFASFLFVALGALAIRAGGRGDLDERRRRIRAWVGPAVAVYLVVVLAVQAWVLYAGGSTPKSLVLINLAFIDGLAALALLSFVRLRVVNWLDLAEPGPALDALSRLERGVLDRLNHRLVPERLYAREGLTIAALAELLGTQEHVLRRVINRGLGFRNFNDFLHSHRLRDASARLGDPTSRRVPVLTVALDVGYGSIGPFNRAFRDRFGVTPTEYRRVALEQHAHRAADETLRHALSR